MTVTKSRHDRLRELADEVHRGLLTQPDQSLPTLPDEGDEHLAFWVTTAGEWSERNDARNRHGALSWDGILAFRTANALGLAASMYRRRELLRLVSVALVMVDQIDRESQHTITAVSANYQAPRLRTWTNHGWWMGNEPEPAEGGPSIRAKCGGTELCEDCKMEKFLAMQAIQQEIDARKPSPMPREQPAMSMVSPVGYDSPDELFDASDDVDPGYDADQDERTDSETLAGQLGVDVPENDKPEEVS